MDSYLNRLKKVLLKNDTYFFQIKKNNTIDIKIVIIIKNIYKSYFIFQ